MRARPFSPWLALVALLVIAGLIALGIWQVERRAWKLALIDRVEHRLHAVSEPMPAPASWSAIDAVKDEYRRITVTGRFLHDRETLVKAVTDDGAGFWVLTPLETADGAVVLINRGFVPPERRDQATRRDRDPAAPVVITGLLRLTEPKGGFLRNNDPAGEHWYSRDVEAIAAARGLPRVAPFFIDADATPNRSGYPRGGLTVVKFHNNHLIYALTWFGLALMLAVMLAGALLRSAGAARSVRLSPGGARVLTRRTGPDAEEVAGSI
ncbi:SURF1 family protein [Bradyrhizobium sp. Tv2a-2]|uniref:SURF1 family protein n=1 Tax=Bradyrhizobium sp. Tv2a-2 TaxID=113395 RepID=UPI000408AC38|nr:SURF1 family protein [Bradyrhizobium sp. Tv2a-2]